MAVDTSFLLIEAEWPSDRARRLAEGMRPQWIVVHRVHEGEDLYYAFAYVEALARLVRASGASVHVAFDLHEYGRSPTAVNEPVGANRTTVVVSRGRVAGVAPATPSPAWRGVFAPGADVGLESMAIPTVERAVEASAPPQVALGDTVPLVVKLVKESSQSSAIPITGAVGDQLDVVITASGGLEVQGKADGTLNITAAGAPMLLFKIAGKSIGPGEVSVLVFQRGEGVGTITIAMNTVAQVSVSNPSTSTTQLQTPSAQQPDLQLLVLESRSGGAVTYTMWFSAADPNLQLNFKSFSFSMQQDPKAFFDAFYADIETILTSGATAQQKIQRLATKGTYLFEQVLSAEARATLWATRTRIRSVHIQSQEPWVPWELLKPSGDDGTGTIVEAGFLCEDYEVTRWVPELGYRHDLTMSSIGVVVPPDSGLIAAIPERDQMLSLQSPTCAVTSIQAEEVTVRKSLASGKLDVIHFTGHGIAAGAASADRAEIRLEAGSRLRPEDLTGVVANLGQGKPIVFLNACEIGRAGMGLTRPGGWPRGFLAAGAGVFIGPFWKVADASAATFAASFYKSLLSGASVAAAAKAARLEIQAASDPTWLAYSVYAHCDARLLPIAPGS